MNTQTLFFKLIMGILAAMMVAIVLKLFIVPKYRATKHPSEGTVFSAQFLV